MSVCQCYLNQSTGKLISQSKYAWSHQNRKGTNTGKNDSKIISETSKNSTSFFSPFSINELLINKMTGVNFGNIYHVGAS